MMRASSSGEGGTGGIGVRVPLSWRALTAGQMGYVCRIMSSGQWATDEVKAAFFIRLARVQRYALARLRPMDIAEHLPLLDWMERGPEGIIRLPRVSGRGAEWADDLQGCPFRTYLSLENYYQGYLLSQNVEALDAMGRLLYPRCCRLLAHERYWLLLWMVGLKAEYGRRFPSLFRAGAEGGEVPSMLEVMNAEIRALTGGDITKQGAVLQADTLDALTELDAKAREAREMEERMKG